MSNFRPIDPSLFRERLGALPDVKAMPKPALRWLPVAKLVVDMSYQRAIAERGVTNLRQIATEFDWVMFAPVIVAAVDKERFAIIDGQHRVTAAALCGVKDVPCQVVVADRNKQASAFAAVNSQVTAITPMQLFAARLAAGDPRARELARVCKAAGVTILRYPVSSKLVKVGETMAAGQLARLLDRFGGDVLGTALRCITQTRKGNAGLVRAPIVAALCAVFDAEPSFRTNEEKLLRAMFKFDFAAQFEAAGKRSYSERCGISTILVDVIADHLDKNLGGGGK